MDQFPIMGVPDGGDTAWMLVSSALVLLMTPGLAFFYGGMVRSKSVLNMIMMSISAMGVVTVLWALYGYSIAFGDDVGNIAGNPSQYWGLKGLIGVNAVAADPSTQTAAVNIPLAGTLPATVFVAFQLMFAIITVALISGAVADRLKFGAWLLFAGLWATFVYFPVAHWVFAFDGFAAEHGGWIANKLHAIDFAGGTAVHINAGVAALMLAIVLGKRRGWPATLFRPHNLPFVMLGAAWRQRWRRPVVRLVRVQRRIGDDRQRCCRGDVCHHHDCDGRGHAWLAAHGARPRWQGYDAGRGVGHRRRTGRHHAVLLVG